MCIYIYTQRDMYMCTHVLIDAHICNTHICIYIHTHTYIYTRTDVYIDAHVCRGRFKRRILFLIIFKKSMILIYVVVFSQLVFASVTHGYALQHCDIL